jgi:hypothetical protein
MRARTPFCIALLAVVLGGCGGKAPSTTATTSTTNTTSTSLTAPSSTPPDSAPLTARLIGVIHVKDGPAQAEVHGKTVWSADIPSGMSLITVKWSLTNPTGTPVRPVPVSRVTYGPNAVPADSMVGWSGQKVLWLDPEPEQIGAGQTVTFWGSWIVPTRDITDAELKLSPPFTNAETYVLPLA